MVPEFLLCLDGERNGRKSEFGRPPNEITEFNDAQANLQALFRIAAFAELKMLTAVNSSGHVERLIHRLLVAGHYDRHLKRLGQRTEAALTRVPDNLLREGDQIYVAKNNGYYLYLMLPTCRRRLLNLQLQTMQDCHCLSWNSPISLWL